MFKLILTFWGLAIFLIVIMSVVPDPEKNEKIVKAVSIDKISKKNKSTRSIFYFFETKKEFNIKDWLEDTQNHTLIKKAKNNYAKEIAYASKKSGVSEREIISVMINESSVNPNTKRGDGIGLMQVKATTAAKYGLNPYKVNENILAGALYLRDLRKRFHGDKTKAFIAYNWGPSRVAKAIRLAGNAKNVIYFQKVNALINYKI